MCERGLMTGHKLAGIRFVLEDGKCVLVSFAAVVWGHHAPSPATKCEQANSRLH